MATRVKGVGNLREWEKMAAPCNMGGEMKYFSLLTVIFLSVSSSEILCLLSFHNEIHSFSFVVTKPVISPSLLQRPLHYNIGSGVVMKVTILSPKLCKTP